ncbi:MAG: hypothetical protein AVDCRST_MAG51-2055, partial [uncultured Ramlibacter sp.]
GDARLGVRGRAGVVAVARCPARPGLRDPVGAGLDRLLRAGAMVGAPGGALVADGGHGHRAVALRGRVPAGFRAGGLHVRPARVECAQAGRGGRAAAGGPRVRRGVRAGSRHHPAAGGGRGGEHDAVAQGAVVDGIGGRGGLDHGAQGIEAGLARAVRALPTRM